MMRAEENQKRMQLMIDRTMLAVKKSRERLQQTNELLMLSQAACTQIKIKRPDSRMEQSFNDGLEALAKTLKLIP